MDGSTRFGLALVALGVVWAVAYWVTPRPQPSQVRLAEPPKAVAPAPTDDAAVGNDEDASSRGNVVGAGDAVPLASLPGARRSQSDSGVSAPDVVDPLVMGAEEGGDATPRAAVRVVPPEFRMHEVERGETANSISRRYFGTTGYWAAIMKSNPNVDFGRGLKVGQRIRVPVDPENVQGKLVPTGGGGEGSDGEGAGGDADAPESPTGYIEYVVERGDTLSEIAKAIYGSARRWRVIRDANRDKVNAEGTNIRPGMVLKLPPPGSTGDDD